MTPATFFVLCAVLFAPALSLAHALGSSEGQGQDLGQDVRYGQGQGRSGGRQGGFAQQGAFGGDAGEMRPGFGGRSFGGQQAGEDASRYNFRIYTEPEYYGYESKFPGGRAMFKSYRSSDSTLGRQGGQGGQGEYSGSGRSARLNENSGFQGGLNARTNENFGSPRNQQPQY